MQIKTLLASPLGFTRGFSYPFVGLRFVYLEHVGLARYWVAPVLITAVALAGVIWGAVTLQADVVDWVWSLFPSDWLEGEGWIARGFGFLRGVTQLLVGLIIGLLGMVLVALSSSLIAAPFNDALSEAVERIVTGNPMPPFSISRVLRDLGRTLRLEGLKLLLYLAVIVPLFVGSFFIPVVGQLLSVVAFFLTALYLAFDYIDWPAARRDVGVGERLGLLRRHPASMFGFGTGVWCFLLVPFVNLLFMPAAVAGGTLLYLALEERNRPVSAGN